MLIVDDGSTDRTAKVAFDYVRKYKIDNVRVLLLRRNHGKGEAIRKVSLFSFSITFPFHLSFESTQYIYIFQLLSCVELNSD